MGGESSPTSASMSQETLGQLSSELPGYANAILATTPTFSQAATTGTLQVAPELNALQQMLYNTYGPQITQTQNQIGGQAAQAATQQTANQVNSPAASQVVSGAQNLAQQANPQYFNLIGNYANGLNQALGVLSPNLTGSQISQITRGQNTASVGNGTVNTPNVSQTAANAANFGTAGQTQATNFANTLNSMVSGAGNFITNPNTFSQATGANNAASTGVGNANSIFQGQSASSPSGATASNSANSVLNSLTGLSESATAAHPSMQPSFSL